MKKRIFYSFLLLATISHMFACPKDGIYIGAGAGASFDESTITARNTVNGFRLNRKPKKTHAVGNVFLGYGHTFCNCFFLGFEGGTYFPRRTLTVSRPGVALTTFTFRDHVTVQDYFTGDILPGIRISSDLLIYARGGCCASHLSLKQDANTAAGVPQFKNSITECGWRVGAGIHYSFFRNVSIGLDYFYSFYPTVRTQITGFNTVVNARTRANYIGVSLAYNFPMNLSE